MTPMDPETALCQLAQALVDDPAVSPATRQAAAEMVSALRDRDAELARIVRETT